MAVELIDTIKQKNNGTFPLMDNNDVKGGHYQLDTLVERDNIPTIRRKELMFCSVVEDGKTYQLQGGIDNINWKEFSSGSKQIIIPTFVISTLLKTGTQPINIQIPKDGVIKTINANCSTVGSTSCEISVEKTNSTGIETNTGWVNILSSNLIIATGKYTDDKSVVVSSDIVNQGDVLRLNVIQNGTSIKGITIQISIEI